MISATEPGSIIVSSFTYSIRTRPQGPQGVYQAQIGTTSCIASLPLSQMFRQQSKANWQLSNPCHQEGSTAMPLFASYPLVWILPARGPHFSCQFQHFAFSSRILPSRHSNIRPTPAAACKSDRPRSCTYGDRRPFPVGFCLSPKPWKSR